MLCISYIWVFRVSYPSSWAGFIFHLYSIKLHSYSLYAILKVNQYDTTQTSVRTLYAFYMLFTCIFYTICINAKRDLQNPPHSSSDSEYRLLSVEQSSFQRCDILSSGSSHFVEETTLADTWHSLSCVKYGDYIYTTLPRCVHSDG